MKKAFEAYQLSVDPYAHYRLGQAYEEGWTGEVDTNKAMKWYKQAAEEGHHLAIKRMKRGCSRDFSDRVLNNPSSLRSE